jgi:hypothetical protein
LQEDFGLAIDIAYIGDREFKTLRKHFDHGFKKGVSLVPRVRRKELQLISSSLGL